VTNLVCGGVERLDSRYSKVCIQSLARAEGEMTRLDIFSDSSRQGKQRDDKKDI
jgi:hypothetical protein